MAAAVRDLRANDPLLRVLQQVGASDGDRGHDDTAVRDDLASIATKLGRPLVAPDRPFTEDERQTIALLRAILHAGRLARTWTSLAFAMSPDAAKGVLDAFAGGAVCSLGADGPGEAVELFGTTLPLGSERLILLQARLVNEQEVRARLATRSSADAAIELRFAPGENNIAPSLYLDWFPAPERSSVAPTTRSNSILPLRINRPASRDGAPAHGESSCPHGSGGQ